VIESVNGEHRLRPIIGQDAHATMLMPHRLWHWRPANDRPQVDAEGRAVLSEIRE
jgi:hypothetical protein